MKEKNSIRQNSGRIGLSSRRQGVYVSPLRGIGLFRRVTRRDGQHSNRACPPIEYLSPKKLANSFGGNSGAMEIAWEPPRSSMDSGINRLRPANQKERTS